MNTNPDINHLQRYACDGDATAFEHLARTYQGMVYSVCMRMLGNRADAEDATQETFLLLARKSATIQSNVAGWLHECARQCSLSLLRRRSAVRARDENAAQLRPKLHEDEPTPWHEVQLIIDESLAELDEPTRQLIIDRFFLGQTQEQLAEQAQISQSMMSRRIRQSVDRLRDVMRSKGVIIPATLLVTGLLTESAQAASVSAALTKSLTSIGLSGLGAPGAAVTTATAATTTSTATATGSSIVLFGVTMSTKSLIVGAILASVSLGGGAAYVIPSLQSSTVAESPSPAVAVQLDNPKIRVMDHLSELDKLWPELGEGQLEEVVDDPNQKTVMVFDQTRFENSNLLLVIHLIGSDSDGLMSFGQIIDESGKDLFNKRYRFTWKAPQGQTLSPKIKLAAKQSSVIVLRTAQKKLGIQFEKQTRSMDVYLLQVSSEGPGKLTSKSVSEEETRLFRNDDLTFEDKKAWGDKDPFANRQILTTNLIAFVAGNCIDRVVLDETGLKGVYDLGRRPDEPNTRAKFADFVTKDQGLKLKLAKRDVEVIVIKSKGWFSK